VQASPFAAQVMFWVQEGVLAEVVLEELVFAEAIMN